MEWIPRWSRGWAGLHTLSLINPPADFRGRALRLPVWDEVNRTATALQAVGMLA